MTAFGIIVGEFNMAHAFVWRMMIYVTVAGDDAAEQLLGIRKISPLLERSPP